MLVHTIWFREQKNADQLEALEKVDNETDVMSVDEFREEWGAVEKKFLYGKNQTLHLKKHLHILELV